MSGHFSRLKSSRANKKVKLDFSNYVTKSDLKHGTRVHRSNFSKKSDLANLKPDVDKLGTDKLRNVPGGLNSLKSKVDILDTGKLETTTVYLGKLNNVVKNDVF